MRAVFLCVCVCVCVCEARSPHDLSVPYFTTFDPDEQIQMHRSNSMGLLCKSVAEDSVWFLLDLLLCESRDVEIFSLKDSSHCFSAD